MLEKPQRSPLLELPTELLDHIFKLVLMVNPDSIDESYIFNGSFNLPGAQQYPGESAKALLNNYGNLCRQLRNIALVAYYENNTLELVVQEDAQWLKYKRRAMIGPELNDDSWIRFGRIFPGRNSHEETQYALELPPRYVRPFIRHICLCMYVPDVEMHVYERHNPKRLEGSSYESRKRRFMETTGYTNESNDWLEPGFNLKEYGFLKASRVTVDLQYYYPEMWDTETGDELKVWVMEKLTKDERVAKALRDGSLRITYSSED